jgi:hypothetical protein
VSSASAQVSSATNMTATDGTLAFGQSVATDNSIITGESLLVDKDRGQELLCGTLIVRGKGYIEVRRTGVASAARTARPGFPGRRNVGWYAVTGLDARNVSRHKIPGRHLDQHAIADDPHGRHRERLEPGQSLLGLAFLVDAKAGVREEDEANAARLDRPSLRTLPEPEAQIEGQSEQQDVDERALEPLEPLLPAQDLGWVGQGIGPESRQSPFRVPTRKAALEQAWHSGGDPHGLNDRAGR